MTLISMRALAPIAFALWIGAAGAVEQEQPLDPEGESELDALRLQVEELIRKVEILENEKATVTAPFKIIGADGKELVTVTEEGGFARLKIGSKTSGQAIIGAFEGGAALQVKDGAGDVKIEINGEPGISHILLRDKRGVVELGSNEARDTTGLMVVGTSKFSIQAQVDGKGGWVKTSDSGGKDVAKISAARETSLQLYDQADKPFFTAGLAEGGHALLSVGGDSASSRVDLGLTKDGTNAFIGVHDKAGVSRALLSSDATEPTISASDSAGKDIFSVGPIGPDGPVQMTVGDVAVAHVQIGLFTGNSGSFVSVIDKAGDPRATLSADGDDPPIAAFHSDAKAAFSVGPFDKTGPFQLTVGDPAAARVQLGVTAGGTGTFVSLTDNSAERARLHAEGDEAPITLSDAKADPIFTVGPTTEAGGGGPLRLTLGNPDKAHVYMGLSGGDAGSYFSLYDNAGKQRVAMNADAIAIPLALYDPQDEPIFSVGVLEETATPTLILGASDAARLQLGVLGGKTGGYVTIYDEANKERGTFYGEASGSYLMLSDTDVGVTLGSPIDAPPGLTLGKDGTDFLRLSFDETGGYIKVKDKKGTSVAGLLASDKGGSLEILGPQGGTSVGRLWAGEGGGEFGLYDMAGKARTILTASDVGTVDLYGPGGRLGLSSGKTAPWFRIFDAGGEIMAQAGIIPNKNVGTFQVGPGGNGLAGTIGGGLEPASQIVGK